MLMNVRNLRITKPAHLAALWRVAGLFGALLLLSSCAIGNQGQSTTAPKPTATFTPKPTQTAPNLPSPFKPDDLLSLLALQTCNLSAAPGGCFTPEQVQTFYDLPALYAKGFDGKGQTIVIIDSFGSPTIKDDLTTFDQTFGLPDPPKFDIIAPLGAINFDLSNSDQLGWAGETTLDVEWAHAIAPGANIVLLESPTSETEGVQGFPEFEQLSTYAMDHKLGNIISMSFGASERTLVGPDACTQDNGGGQALMQEYDQKVFQRAVQEHITMIASSGDDGATDKTCDLNSDFNVQTVGWPASDPLVTAVGGTKLSLKNDTGLYGSERIWNELGGAGGGGVSTIYNEPEWQKNLPNQSALNGKRGLPDVAWGAAVNFPFYLSVGGLPQWSAIGGTSASAPQWAGLIAIANQMAGKPLGFLNPGLYQLAGQGFHDVTKGGNGLNGVTGFQAATGWDAVSGWGTPDAYLLLPQLIDAVQQTGS
ncbi:MAG TPA: S53 family peptidase [Ktedonobacterales bacterium]|jgi:subtilase family serine protease